MSVVIFLEVTLATLLLLGIGALIEWSDTPAPKKPVTIDKSTTFNNGTDAPMRIEVTLEPGEKLKVPEGLDVHVHMIVYED